MSLKSSQVRGKWKRVAKTRQHNTKFKTCTFETSKRELRPYMKGEWLVKERLGSSRSYLSSLFQSLHCSIRCILRCWLYLERKIVSIRVVARAAFTQWKGDLEIVAAIRAKITILLWVWLRLWLWLWVGLTLDCGHFFLPLNKSSHFYELHSWRLRSYIL